MDYCVVEQADAFTVDMRASLELYHKTAVERREELLDAEVAWLSAAGVHMVVSDTVPLACAAAHAAQLPCAVVTNFSWGESSTLHEQDVLSHLDHASKRIRTDNARVAPVLWELILRLVADFIYSQYAMESGSTFQPMVWQIAEDLSRADVLLRLPGHSPMPAFRAVEDIPLIARLPRRSRAEVAHRQLVVDAVGRLRARQCTSQRERSQQCSSNAMCAPLPASRCEGSWALARTSAWFC
jgi:L-arabinokinase